MARTLLILTFALTGFGCASYTLDDRPPGEGGGATDGSVPGDVDSGTSDPDGGNGGPTDAGFDVCKDQGRKISLSPLDLLVLLDVSYSMDYDQKWSSVRSAMKSFVSKPEFNGLGIGVQYFPLRSQCSVGQYLAPAVPFGVLPGVGPIVGASLDQQEMSGGTPTVQALEGTTAYTQNWLALHPDHKAVIVMATDGVPDSTCAGATDGGLSNSLANVLLVAGGAATSSPPVKTFVIGVGKDLTALNGIAAAGGTGQALLVDTSTNADVAFLNALTQIRRSALGCDFEIPVGSAVVRDRAQVNFVPDDGSPTLYVGQVANKAACVAGAGWFFDDADPLIATKVVLCDTTCDTVTQGKTGALHVEFACGPT